MAAQQRGEKSDPLRWAGGHIRQAQCQHRLTWVTTRPGGGRQTWGTAVLGDAVTCFGVASVEQALVAGLGAGQCCWRRLTQPCLPVRLIHAGSGEDWGY